MKSKSTERRYKNMRNNKLNIAKDELVFPELTEERRKELAKDIKKKGEGAKVAVRNIRRDAMDHFKKVGKAEDISEDEIKDLEDKIQKLTDSYVAKIDKAVEAKSQEILTV
jgi:ribosome recycling factor